MKRARSSAPSSKKNDANPPENLTMEQFERMDAKFKKVPINQVIQNAISANSINEVCQNRNYLQGYDRTFSNVIEPELDTTDQMQSGRCWIFAVLNVARHKMVCQYELENDFEFSQCYLSFWDKLEKCNYFLNEIIRNRHLDNFLNDKYIECLLHDPISDGGQWVTCKNLIKKYGLVPRTVFDESFNSSNTMGMNYILEYKLRQFAKELYGLRSKADSECYRRKDEMMDTVYHIMCKLFGSPKLPNSPFDWSYCIDQEKDMAALIERQVKRRKTDKYENLELKKKMTTNAIDYYRDYVPFDCDSLIQLNHDPRNPYYKCYTSDKPNTVYGGERVCYLNVPIEKLIEATHKSILDNTPVIFMCDISKHVNMYEGLLDNKCFNYESIFNTSFEKMDKASRLSFRESNANHAMTIVGVDLDQSGGPIKWEVENSWGQITGNFIMTTDWFRDYVFEIVVDEKYLDVETMRLYQREKSNPVVFPFDDPMV